MNVRFAIAVHVLVWLESEQSGCATTESIAEQLGVHGTYARQIVASLVRAGILRGHRGRRGGIALARPSKEISLLDVFRVFEPVNRSLVPIHEIARGDSFQAKQIRDLVHSHILEAEAALGNELRKVTVGQIVDGMSGGTRQPRCRAKAAGPISKPASSRL